MRDQDKWSCLRGMAGCRGVVPESGAPRLHSRGFLRRRVNGEAARSRGGNGHRRVELQSQGFADLVTADAARDDFMQEAKEIRQIKPEPTVQTPRIQPSVHKGVMPLYHHEAFALETAHMACGCALLDRTDRSGFR